MREHGHIGIGLPVSGDQESRRADRPARRRASGPHPVRPPALQVSPRPDAVPAVRRPVALGGGAADPGGVDPGGVEPGVRGFGEAAAVDANGLVGRAGLIGAPAAVDGLRAMGAVGVVGGASGRYDLAPAGAATGARAGARARGASALDGAPAAAAGREACGARAVEMARAGSAESAGGPGRARGVAGARVLVRRLQVQAPRRGDRVRRVMAGLALVLAAAAVVVGLGRVADLTAQARGAAAPAVSQAAEITVTVAAPGTVWDVADGVSPGASGPQRAALVDRIVVANSLTSVRVRPGQVLRVPL